MLWDPQCEPRSLAVHSCPVGNWQEVFRSTVADVSRSSAPPLRSAPLRPFRLSSVRACTVYIAVPPTLYCLCPYHQICTVVHNQSTSHRIVFILWLPCFCTVFTATVFVLYTLGIVAPTLYCLSVVSPICTVVHNQSTGHNHLFVLYLYYSYRICTVFTATVFVLNTLGIVAPRTL